MNHGQSLRHPSIDRSEERRAASPAICHDTAAMLVDPHSAESVSRRRWAAIWVVIAVACLAIDIPVAIFCKADRTPGELQLMLSKAENFGHAYGVLAIAITVAVVDATRRPLAPRLLLGAMGAGLLADVLKLLVVRSRPRFYDLSQGLWHSFAGALGWNGDGEWKFVFDNTQQSFPSAHTACAVGLAAGLGILYPQGRVWFYTLAFLCAMNRVDGCAHFASDAAFGAAIGLLVANWTLSSHPSIRWIDRLTAWWGTRRSDADSRPDARPPLKVVSPS